MGKRSREENRKEIYQHCKKKYKTHHSFHSLLSLERELHDILRDENYKSYEINNWLNNKLSFNQRLNLNCKDEHGYTPLMIAANQGLSHVCVELVEFGVDLDLRNIYNKTIFDLQSYKGKVKSRIERAILKNKLKDKNNTENDIITWLKQKDIDVDLNFQMDYNLDTPLMLAVDRNFPKVMVKLCFMGADYNLKDKNGYIISNFPEYTYNFYTSCVEEYEKLLGNECFHQDYS